jgi:3-methyladenine DNA glycosylase AlkD
MLAMTYDEVMSRLESLGDERLRQQNARHGVGEKQFGVKMGDLRALAKEIKLNPTLANELWESSNFEAMLLAMLLMKPKGLSTDDLERMVKTIPHANVADWFSSYILKPNPKRESLRSGGWTPPTK